MDMPEGVVQVSDGRSAGFDETGNCIYSVPVEWIARYLDEVEAEQIERCIDADQRLLSYAQ